MPSMKQLRQAMRDFTNQDPEGMSRKEMEDFLQDQLAEMRKEPDNAKTLERILTMYDNRGVPQISNKAGVVDF